MKKMTFKELDQVTGGIFLLDKLLEDNTPGKTTNIFKLPPFVKTEAKRKYAPSGII